MRTLIAAGLAVLAAGLSACTGLREEDAGVDAPRDAPRDVGVDVALSDAGTPTLIEGPAFATGCPDWDVVVDPVRWGLPADATPRVLWSWTPRLDPAWDLSSSLSPEILHVTRSPTSRIYATVGGLRGTRLATLSAEGELVSLSGIRPGFDYPPIALPDGRIAMLHIEASTEGGTGPATLITMNDAGDTSEVRGGDASYPPLGPRLDAAVGAHGRVYFAGSDWIAASCGGDELLWLLRFPTGGYSLFQPRVADDGTLWVSVGTADSSRWASFTENGGFVSWSAIPSEMPPRSAYSVEWANDLTLITGGNEEETRFLSFRRDGLSWSGPTLDQWTARWDATGSLWVENWAELSGGTRPLRRFDSEGLVFEATGPRLDRDMSVLADGGFFGRILGEPRSVGALDPTDGSVRWQLPLSDPTGTGILTSLRGPVAISPSGVAYFSGGFTMYAVQLDRLPPEGPYCLGSYCGNARMDGAARRFEN